MNRSYKIRFTLQRYSSPEGAQDVITLTCNAQRLNALAISCNPYDRRCNIDLGVFNAYDQANRLVVAEIEKYIHPDFPIPQTLEQWEQQIRMSILIYGAFYEVYNKPGERYVGGGADIVTLPWPT